MKAGRTLAGRYQLHELLGEGAMGAVYAASDVDGTPLAIKFLREDVAKLPGVAERFQREAVHARKIQSPHVARVVAAGASGKRLWIAFERLTGETLEQCLAQKRCLAAALANRIFGHVLDGLEAGHSVGVIHRDVKPANIFLVSGETPRACLLDFGVSKYRPNEGSTPSPVLTGTADVLGTVRYMAPEQVEDAQHVDARADLYALVTVLFRMLTGALPYRGQSRATMLIAKLNDPALHLSDVTGVAWPSPLETFFARGLARAPGDRFGTTALMREAWAAIIARTRVPAPQTFDPRAQEEFDPTNYSDDRDSPVGSTVVR